MGGRTGRPYVHVRCFSLVSRLQLLVSSPRPGLCVRYNPSRFSSRLVRELLSCSVRVAVPVQKCLHWIPFTTCHSLQPHPYLQLPRPARILVQHRPSPVPPAAGTAPALLRPLALCASGSALSASPAFVSLTPSRANAIGVEGSFVSGVARPVRPILFFFVYLPPDFHATASSNAFTIPSPPRSSIQTLETKMYIKELLLFDANTEPLERTRCHLSYHGTRRCPLMSASKPFPFSFPFCSRFPLSPYSWFSTSSRTTMQHSCGVHRANRERAHPLLLPPSIFHTLAALK